MPTSMWVLITIILSQTDKLVELPSSELQKSLNNNVVKFAEISKAHLFKDQMYTILYF